MIPHSKSTSSQAIKACCKILRNAICTLECNLCTRVPFFTPFSILTCSSYPLVKLAHRNSVRWQIEENEDGYGWGWIASIILWIQLTLSNTVEVLYNTPWRKVVFEELCYHAFFTSPFSQSFNGTLTYVSWKGRVIGPSYWTFLLIEDMHMLLMNKWACQVTMILSFRMWELI